MGRMFCIKVTVLSRERDEKTDNILNSLSILASLNIVHRQLNKDNWFFCLGACEVNNFMTGNRIILNKGCQTLLAVWATHSPL